MSQSSGVQRRAGSQKELGVQEGMGFKRNLEKWFAFSQVEKGRGGAAQDKG